MGSNFTRRKVIATIAAVTLPGAAWATGPTDVTLQPAEASAAVLSVIAPDGTVTRYDTNALEALGAQRMTVTNPWHGEDATFDGVLFSRLLDLHGLGEVEAIRVVAQDEYAVTFTRDAIDAAPILISTRLNGEVMGRRQRGPFFFAINPDDIERSDALAGRHNVWFAAEIRTATPEER